MAESFFKVLHQSKKSKARVGEINTAHGVIKTPAFFVAATKGTVKALPPIFLKETGSQVAFVNTYHLVDHPGVEVIEKAGGMHKFANFDLPLMSDSGGFQMFSLANSKFKNQKAKLQFKMQNYKDKKAEIRGEEEPLVIKISDEGVLFRSTYDGKLIELTPEKSIDYQMKIGADIMIAFDECPPYPSTYEYAKRAMGRTHKWLLHCIDQFKIQKSKIKMTNQNLKIENCKLIENWKLKIKNYPRYLYGVIHGGTFEDLRKESAKFVVSQDTDGIAIGGVAVGEPKEMMRKEVEWVAPYLPKDRPVHLLGVGHFDDYLASIVQGVDTFDCVEPTRLARMGRIYQYQILNIKYQKYLFDKLKILSLSKDISNIKNYEGNIDILKTRYKNDLSSVDESCHCWACRNFTKAYLHHLFKQREILGYTLATYHNIWLVNKFFERLRKAIANDYF